jgi:hypothetical protein
MKIFTGLQHLSMCERTALRRAKPAGESPSAGGLLSCTEYIEKRPGVLKNPGTSGAPGEVTRTCGPRDVNTGVDKHM